MSNALRRGMVAALVVVFVAALMGGCSFFKGQDKDDPFAGGPEKTSSSRPADTTISDSNASMNNYEPPAETWVEPARPWGAETRDNIEQP